MRAFNLLSSAVLFTVLVMILVTTLVFSVPACWGTAAVLVVVATCGVGDGDGLAWVIVTMGSLSSGGDETGFGFAKIN